MAKLKHEDRAELLAILVSSPILQTHSDRYEMLKLADLDPVIPLINLDGAPMMAISRILTALESFGRMTYEQEALGLFLSRVKEFIGPSDPKRTLIEEILVKYDLMTPSKAPLPVNHWRSPNTPEQAMEKIIGENTLRHISFLEQGLKMSRAVAFIEYTEWTGTGFMVSSNMLLTNNHVIPSAEILGDTDFTFNYQLTFDRKAQKVQAYKAVKNGIFLTDSILDYSLIELEGSPGRDWGMTPLGPGLVKSSTRVNIIQHPGGLPKRISFQNNMVEYADTHIVQYLTSTMPGSSGSPVFDDNWQVVAVHHAGGDLLEPASNRIFFRNEGIAIGAILDSIPSEIRASFAS